MRFFLGGILPTLPHLVQTNFAITLQLKKYLNVNSCGIVDTCALVEEEFGIGALLDLVGV